MLTRLTSYSVRSQRLLCTRSKVFCHRLYATKTPAPTTRLRPPPAQSPIKIPKPRSSQPTPQSYLEIRQKQGIADKLFEQGHSELFRAPSHKGLLITCWLISFSAGTGILYLYNSKLWKQDVVTKRGLPWWIGSIYSVTMLFMTGMLGWCISQSFFFITAIKLVKDREITKLLVLERSKIPFLRPKKYLIPPPTFQIERGVVGYIQNPNTYQTEVGKQASVGAEVGGILKKMVLSPYVSVRKLFWHEGVLKVSVPNEKKKEMRVLHLDLDGQFSNGGKDLLDIATLKD